MDGHMRRAIDAGLTCDITTRGRRSGQLRRIEIWYFVVDGVVYLTGTPGPRDWYANLLADPQLTFHVKQGARADLPATATPVLDDVERRRVMGAVMAKNGWFRGQGHSLDDWVAGSPLLAISFAE